MFFIISGFFIANKNSNEKIQTIKKLFLIFIISNVLYLFYNLLLSYKGDKLAIYIYIYENILNLKVWVRSIFFNISPFGRHLWYISALIYCHIVYFFIKPKIKEKNIIIAIVSLSTIGVILCTIIPLFTNKSLDYIWYRNWLFEGLPYYFIGIMLKRKQIKEYDKKYLYLFLITLVIHLIEIYFFHKFKPNITYDYFISSILICTSLIAFAISYPDVFRENNFL